VLVCLVKLPAQHSRSGRHCSCFIWFYLCVLSSGRYPRCARANHYFIKCFDTTMHRHQICEPLSVDAMHISVRSAQLLFSFCSVVFTVFTGGEHTERYHLPVKVRALALHCSCTYLPIACHQFPSENARIPMIRTSTTVKPR
jgi:hypothetical protein